MTVTRSFFMRVFACVLFALVATCCIMAGAACSSANAEDASDLTPSAALPEGSTFSITFLDVGQGDAAVVQCDGHYMLIDGGPKAASNELYSYFSRNGISTLDYLVASHPDTDHTGGLPGALQYATAQRAFCSVTSAKQDSFNDTAKRLADQGVQFEVPKTGSTFDLGSAKVTVIGPVAVTDNNDANDDSLMLRITYGGTSFVFTGDASADEERATVEKKYVNDSDVLKVAHHGSSHSTCYPFLREVDPAIAVISVGASNSYGHPSGDTLSRLRDCGCKVLRTDMQGDITVTSNGEKVEWSVARNANVDTLSSVRPETTFSVEEKKALDTSEAQYIGNVKSHKFHKPNATDNLPAEKNRIYFDTYDDAIAQGYEPCKRCWK